MHGSRERLFSVVCLSRSVLLVAHFEGVEQQSAHVAAGICVFWTHVPARVVSFIFTRRALIEWEWSMGCVMMGRLNENVECYAKWQSRRDGERRIVMCGLMIG